MNKKTIKDFGIFDTSNLYAYFPITDLKPDYNKCFEKSVLDSLILNYIILKIIQNKPKKLQDFYK